MRETRSWISWLLVGIAAAAALPWAFRQAYPLVRMGWELSSSEARAVALERLSDLGPLPEDPYVLTVLDQGPVLESRMQRELPRLGAERILGSRASRDLQVWEVRLYDIAGTSREWTHRARITPWGEVTEMRLGIPPEEEGGAIDPDEARRQADAFLEREGVDLASYEEPEVRRQQLQSRTDLVLRYRDGERLLGAEHPYGLEVLFAGERLAGYRSFSDDPERSAIQQGFQTLTLVNQAWVFVALLLVPVVAIPFVKRYHAGEVGVRRALQIGAVVLGLGIVMMLFSARAAGAGWTIGVLNRQQITWIVAFQMIVLFFFPLALMSFLSWSVGESLARERWGRKLAAFDAFFQFEWKNATFARAALQGTVAGLVLPLVDWLAVAAARPLGVYASGSFLFGPWWEGSAWFAFPLAAFGVLYSLYTGLFGRLLLLSSTVPRFGVVVGVGVATVVPLLVFFPSVLVMPFSWHLLFGAITPLLLAILFLRTGIFTTLVAGAVSFVASSAVPLLDTADPSIQLQASLALLLVALPAIVSLRHLASDREFVYRYEDVPPHVRRIAERERQRVELETARGIQSSILPDLPSQLNGVELAHAYLPATEVGGDFYDVLSLEDGRLAVAVGDVAGHGVSSGLVMSMAKSALAVQVTFDPEVEAVFGTLNRMVFQSARKRLLTTLCYALVDPVRHEMFFASAGHLFPYRVTKEGSVLALESVSYPLGVRGELEVRVRGSQLASGDTLVLFSDGLTEAHAEGSDDLYGFDRFEQSLRLHVGGSLLQYRDAILRDVERFTRNAPREDDMTLLLLRIA